jgi:type IX secretion system PorP/SprF family membrane protein
MKVNHYIILCIAILLLPTHELFAQQDPLYSQYMFNPLAINPAYAGSRGVFNGGVSLRRQWVGFDGAPTTSVLTANIPGKKGKTGLGIEILNDQLGPRKTIAGYLSYSYRIRLANGKLGFGLAAGVLNSRINWNAIDYRDQGDVFASLNATQSTVPDFKFGLYFNNKNFYTGFSVTHLNEPVYAIVKDSLTFRVQFARHTFFTIGRAFQLSSNVIFSPSLILRNVAGSRMGNADLNLNFNIRNALWLGISLRSEKSLVYMIQCKIMDQFKLGYSYDMTFGRLRSVQSGTHEFFLGFDLDFYKSQTLSPRYF